MPYPVGRATINRIAAATLSPGTPAAVDEDDPSSPTSNSIKRPDDQSKKDDGIRPSQRVRTDPQVEWDLSKNDAEFRDSFRRILYAPPTAKGNASQSVDAARQSERAA